MPLRGPIPLVLLLLALPGRPAGAQRVTETQVEIVKDADHLDLTLWLRQADLLEGVLADSTGRTAFADVSELRTVARRIGLYAQGHVEAVVDGRTLQPADWRGWPPDVLPTEDDARGAAATGEPGPPRLPLTMRYPLPPGARRLDLKLTLYGDGVPASRFDVSARQASQLITRTDYVKNGQVIRYDLQDEALTLASTAPSTAPAPGAVEAGSGPGAAGRAPGEGFTPGAAAAATASRRTFLETTHRFLYLGFTHIVPRGPDHILFVLALFLLAPGFMPLFKQVTAFTIAHSVTLGLAMLGVVHLPNRVVEPLIALSIAVVAIENVFRREMNPGRWMVVSGFGLIHGLDYAGALGKTSWPPGQLPLALLGFNVGMEFGQLAVLLAAALLTLPVIRKRWYHARVTVPVSGAIAAVGLYWAVTRALG